MDSSRRQDSEYLIFIWFDTWRPKVMRTGPSCTVNKFLLSMQVVVWGVKWAQVGSLWS